MPTLADNFEKLEFLIDGEWTTGDGTGSEPVVNPATGETLAQLPHATIADLDRALLAAERGFAVWRKTHPGERARILNRAANLIREHADRIARIATMEQGKPLAMSRIEVLFSADRVEWLAEEGKRNSGKLLPPAAGGEQRRIVYEPIGVTLGLAPWNNPAMMPVSKVAHALAAGCSIILKPAEETPGTAVALMRLFQEAGVPPGVINLVFGVPAEVSGHLIASPIVRKVSFTGSVPVGKLLFRQCADTMKKMTMELGGHSPFIVFDDVDLDEVVEIAVANKFRNAGQVCVSPTRFYVQESIVKPFTERFVERTRHVKLGNGLEPGVQMGPLANARRLASMDELVSDAAQKGATVNTGGKRHGNVGFFYEPTVLTNLGGSERIMKEEPFGPVGLIIPWQNQDEVVRAANALPFGLASYAFTRSQKRAIEISEALEAGLVGINSTQIGAPDAPFGGVKDSGFGREGGSEGLSEYYVSKVVTTREA